MPPTFKACILASALTVSGCGTVPPAFDLRHPSGPAFDAFVEAIALHVRCELKDVANCYYLDDPTSRRHILRNWAAKVALTVRALDKGSINPGVAGFDRVMSFAFQATAGFEADGTREMTLTYFLLFDELLDGTPHDSDHQRAPPACPLPYDDPIAGDVGVAQTVSAALKVWDTPRSLSDHVIGGPYDTITHHVVFMLVAGATATPTWRFVHVSANTAPPFISAQRTSTNELLITMGPAVLGTRKEDGKIVRVAAPSPALDQAFEVERIRSAFTASPLATINPR